MIYAIVAACLVWASCGIVATRIGISNGLIPYWWPGCGPFYANGAVIGPLALVIILRESRLRGR